MAVPFQILHCQFAADLMQRMERGGSRDRPIAHQHLAPVAGRQGIGADRKIDGAREQHFVRAAHDGFEKLDPRLRVFGCELVQTAQQEPCGKQPLHRKAKFLLLALGEVSRRTLQSCGFVDERFAAPIEHMALARQQGLAALDLKNRDAQALLDMVGWLKAGQVKIRETVVDGLENAPSAFIDLFRGANHGKMLVRLVADAASGEWGP
ncbi:hypothetical protein [Ensifer sp. Root31]|uniref:hypothetical protein n=1 Tax=Ensifer sp. Root31 TaxID=1736512 RepID=UPI001FCDA8B7|nr:hypothetical protein [Ensifer sp. Root31]